VHWLRGATVGDPDDNGIVSGFELATSLLRTLSRVMDERSRLVGPGILSTIGHRLYGLAYR
jgi:hypothetical protein